MRKRLKRSGTVNCCCRKRVFNSSLSSQQLREVLNLAEDIPIEFTAHGESPAKVAAALAAASLEENAAAEAEAETETEVKAEEVAKTEA